MNKLFYLYIILSLSIVSLILNILSISKSISNKNKNKNNERYAGPVNEQNDQTLILSPSGTLGSGPVEEQIDQRQIVTEISSPPDTLGSASYDTSDPLQLVQLSEATIGNSVE